MSDYDLKYYGDPVLRSRAQEVPEIQNIHFELIEKMKKAMKKNHGCGLAANQIGVPDRIIVVEVSRNKITAMINPVIIEASESTDLDIESCLSVPKVYAPVQRHTDIKVEFQDFSGSKQVKDFKGRSARIIQHEVDHLDGIFFFDKATPLAQWKSEEFEKLKASQEEKGLTAW